jgi:serine/threonine protein kinase
MKLELSVDDTNAKGLQFDCLIAKAGASNAKIYSVMLHGLICAVKQVDIEFPEDAEQIEREIRILESLPPHPNIIKYLHHTRTPSQIRVFMTLYSGTLCARVNQRKGDAAGILLPTAKDENSTNSNLRLVLSPSFLTETASTPARNYMRPEEIRQILRDVTSGIQHLHKKRIIHGGMSTSSNCWQTTHRQCSRTDWIRCVDRSRHQTREYLPHNQ